MEYEIIKVFSSKNIFWALELCKFIFYIFSPSESSQFVNYIYFLGWIEFIYSIGVWEPPQPAIVIVIEMGEGGNCNKVVELSRVL